MPDAPRSRLAHAPPSGRDTPGTAVPVDRPADDSRAVYRDAVTFARSVALFALAAVAEIGGCWMVWQGVREHRGLLWAGAGVIALGLYGFVATLQEDASFGRVLAAYGGVFVAGSLAWAMAFDGYRPDRYDVLGALVCLGGVGLIMYAPRG
nr:YnfA family protein [Motilibacter aurantiacus]